MEKYDTQKEERKTPEKLRMENCENYERLDKFTSNDNAAKLAMDIVPDRSPNLTHIWRSPLLRSIWDRGREDEVKHKP